MLCKIEMSWFLEFYIGSYSLVFMEVRTMEEQALLFISEREMDRLSVIRCVIQRKMTWKQAAHFLELSERQIARLVSRIRKQGSRGIIHRLRGKPSNHRLKENIIPEAIRLVKTYYPDFGPTFACEKLQKHGVYLSRESLRQAMTQVGLWQVRMRKPKHRSWRPRRLFMGELIQLDASHHDWFEGRAPLCALIAYVDDATGKILYAEFVLGEDTMTLFKTTKRYLLRHGRPKAFYVDKHAVYHVNQQSVVEPFLRDPQPMTQFTRAMAELGIEVIPAHSPQAKGRVERSFETLQDRLVKEMRLRGISSIREANQFLWEEFLPDYNERFGKLAANPLDAHRPILETQKLDHILCLKTQRRVLNDFTLRFKGQILQIEKNLPVLVKPKDKVTVIVSVNGSLELMFKGHKLPYKVITPVFPDPKVLRGFKNRHPKPKLEAPATLAHHWWVSWRFHEFKMACQRNNHRLTSGISNHGKGIFLGSNGKFDGFLKSEKTDLSERTKKQDYQLPDISILQKT